MLCAVVGLAEEAEEGGIIGQVASAASFRLVERDVRGVEIDGDDRRRRRR